MGHSSASLPVEMEREEAPTKLLASDAASLDQADKSDPTIQSCLASNP